MSQLLAVACLKRSPDHSIVEINAGKRRIRHATTLKLNDELPTQNRLDSPIQSRYMSDPFLSDIDFKN